MKLYTATAAAKEIGIGDTYMKAMVASGMKPSHGRFFSLPYVLGWMEEHKGFKITDVWPRKTKDSKPSKRLKVRTSQPSGKSCEP